MTTPANRPSGAYLSPAAMPAIVIIAAAILLSGRWSSATPLVLIDDGQRVAALLLALAGFGAWPTLWLLGRAVRGTQAYLLSTALGAGILGLIVLLLGCAGLLSKPVAWAIVSVGIGLGLLRLIAASASSSAQKAGESQAGFATVKLVWLEALVLGVLAWPLSIAIFGATLPPGLLWLEEGNAYDVLEYHLQAPREYFESGRIEFLPHNVYAQFPQQVEILYLLLMHLRGDAHEAALSAQLLHLAFGVLAVVAVGAWLPQGPPRWVGVLVAGGVPWLPYLGCLAYNELGVLYFATLSFALIVRAIAEPVATDQRRSLIFAGLLAGLATGAKLTAVGVVAAPLVLAWVILARASLARRLALAAAFSLAAFAAFSPWLARNYAFTGNPVYPFAYEQFGGRDWSAEQAAQWKQGHALPVVDQPPAKRVALAWREAFASSLFGPGVFALALVGFALRRDREAMLLLLLALLALLAWITLTHMPGRFLVPIVGALALLAGRGAALVGKARTAVAPILVLLAIGSAVAGAVQISTQIDAAAARYRRITNVPLADMVDHIDFVLDAGQPLNHVAEAHGTKLWIVGDAAAFYITTPHRYTVVFNRDPWIEFAKDATPAAGVDWLRSNGYSHVVFCWPEIQRLAGTYGFPSHVTRSWVEALAAAGLERVGPINESAEAEPAAARYDTYRIAPAAGEAGKR